MKQLRIYVPIGISILLACSAHCADFKLGIENISDSFAQRLKGRSIGLITNQTGIDQQGRRNVDILVQKGLKIAYLFAPEHGLAGTVAAGEDVDIMVDQKTGIPVISLYKKGTGQTLDQDILAKLDMLIFDMQDSGMRHYTYISTLMRVMQAAAEHDKPLVVLDRPNPLGGTMEGPLVEEHLRSFISIAPIPLRHGMTIGELAWYFNIHELEKPVQLHVVKMNNYNRFDTSSSKCFAALSPNIQTMQACYGYSFLGLLGEIGPFSVGVNTNNAFQCILLPKSCGISNGTWRQLQTVLHKHGIESIPHQRFSNNRQEYLDGLKVQVKEITCVSSFDLLTEIVGLFRKAGLQFSFSSSFDKAIGTDKMQKLFLGKINKTSVMREINRNLSHFFQKAAQAFMYDSLPQVVLMQ